MSADSSEEWSVDMEVRKGIDIQSKDPNCIQGCTQTYSMCISNASISGGNRLVANDVIRACGGALRICSDTCPAR